MSSRRKYESLEKLVGKPGTLSKVVNVGLDIILNEGILHKKRRSKSEVALSFHLTDEWGKTGFMKKQDFFWGLGSLLKNERIGIIYKQKLNGLLEGGIPKKDLKEFIGNNKVRKGELKNLKVKNKVWKGEVKIEESEIEKYCNEKGFEFPKKLSKNEKMKLFRYFIFTQAAFEGMVNIAKSYGIRGIYLSKNKIVPLKRIPSGFIKAIVKRRYTEQEEEIIQKKGKGIDFYEFDEEKKDFVLKIR